MIEYGTMHWNAMGFMGFIIFNQLGTPERALPKTGFALSTCGHGECKVATSIEPFRGALQTDDIALYGVV